MGDRGTRQEKRLPMFANGTIVSDYEPLFHYWEIARKRGREDLVDKAMLENRDFDYIRRMVLEQALNLLEVLDRLEEYFIDRIEPEIAVKALEETLGIELELEEARRRLARILAGWLLEAAQTWGIIRLRGTKLPVN